MSIRPKSAKRRQQVLLIRRGPKGMARSCEARGHRACLIIFFMFLKRDKGYQALQLCPAIKGWLDPVKLGVMGNI